MSDDAYMRVVRSASATVGATSPANQKTRRVALVLTLTGAVALVIVVALLIPALIAYYEQPTVAKPEPASLIVGVAGVLLTFGCLITGVLQLRRTRSSAACEAVPGHSISGSSYGDVRGVSHSNIGGSVYIGPDSTRSAGGHGD